MAYTGTIVSVAEMTFFAGEQVDATGSVEANHNFLAGYAEAFLIDLVKYDIVTNWTSLNAKKKIIFSEYAGRLAAVSLIGYNMSAYGDRIQAEDLINIHLLRLKELLKVLESQDIQNFIGV